MMEWLANISITYILIASAVLLVARLVLGQYKTPRMKYAAETVESVLVAVVLVFLIIRPFVVQAFFIPSGSMIPTLDIHDHILVNKFIYRFQEPKRGDIIVFKSPPAAFDSDLEQMAEYARHEPISDVVYRQQCNLVVGKVTSLDPDSGEVALTPQKYSADDFREMDHLCLLKPGEAARIVEIEDVRKSGDDIILQVSESDQEHISRLVGAEARVSEKDWIKRLIGLPGDTIEVKDGVVYRNGKALDEPYINDDPFGGGATDPRALNMAPLKVPQGQVFVMGDNRNNSNDGRFWGTLERTRVLGKAMITFWPLNRIGLLH